METETINNPKELIDKLAALYEENTYIFRGNADAKYMLTPGAFRKEQIKDAADEFPIKKGIILNKWFENEKIKKSMQRWLRIDNYSYQNGHKINLLFEYIIFLMHYNYSLCKYWSTMPDQKNVDPETRHNLCLQDTEFWAKEENFVKMVDSYLPGVIFRIALDGRILQKPKPFENLTGVDETLPQHYDTPTAALDWTYNPYKAIYFAAKDNNVEYDTQTGIFSAKKIPASHIAIYAFKQFLTENSPIQVKNKNEFITNPRAEAQEGTFTYFTKPCSFYLQNKDFPSIESYDKKDQNFFELKKYIVPNNKETIDFFDKILEEENINEVSLRISS